jgi:hypothetical protein
VSFNAFLKKQSYTLIHLAQNIGGGAKEQACPPNPIIGGGGATAHPAPPKFTRMVVHCVLVGECSNLFVCFNFL